MFFKKKKKIVTEEEFVNKLGEKLESDIPGLDVSIHHSIQLVLGYKNYRKIFSYSEEHQKYLQNPESFEEIYANVKAAFFSLVEVSKVDVEKIFPRIENKQFIKERLEGNSVMENVLYRQFNEELFIFFVEERADKFYPLQKSDLLDLNYSMEELFLKAANNLANLPNIQTHDTNGLIRVSAGGLYESGFIILDLFLRRQLSAPGYIVVAIPTRDTLFVTGSEDQENITKLYDIIKRLKEEGHSIISEKIFLLNHANKMVDLERYLKDCLTAQNLKELKQKNEVLFEKELLSENEFTELIIKKLSDRIEGVKTISQHQLNIITEYRNQIFDFTYIKCYEDYLRRPHLIDETIDNYLHVTVDTHMPKERVKTEKILPVFKGKEAVEILSHGHPGFEKMIFDRYNEELSIYYVESKDKLLYFIQKNDLADLNYSIEDLRAKALENLTAYPGINIDGDEGLYAVKHEGEFSSSLILVKIWNHENFSVLGDIVVAIPNQNIVYVTGSKDKNNIAKLHDFIGQLKEEGLSIVSEKLFVYREDRFEVF